MSEEQAINKCPSHGKLEAQVSGMKEDIREFKKDQKEDIQELKNGQKEILKKIDRFMEVRVDDYKACEEHRTSTNLYVDTKVGNLAKSVKINTENITKGDKKTEKIYTYVGAVMGIFAIAVTIIKLI